MIEKIINYSTKHHKNVVSMSVLLILCLGIYSLFQVPIDAVPDITNNQVQVITKAPNLSTQTVEQFVTYPIEIALSNLPNVSHIRSVSRFGLSVITLVFKDDAGTYLPRQLVAERLKEIDIPKGFGTPTMAPISTGLGEVFQYTLSVAKDSPKQYSPTELRTLQDWIVKRQLSGIKGVVEVNAFGGGIKQYEIAVNPDLLSAMHLDLRAISRAILKNNQDVGGGYIEKDHQANFITGVGTFKTIDEIKNCLIAYKDGTPITIKDVAKVRIHHATRYGAMTQDGKGEAVGGIVMMLKGSNAKKVVKRIETRIKTIQESLPKGVSITPFLNRNDLINRTTNTITNNLLEGALIVIFVLVLLLGNWRGGLIVASTIPLSLLIAFILMHLTGVWVNLMSLGAIDFGIIIDGAVIIVEATLLGLCRYTGTTSKKERHQNATASATKMMRTAFFGQLIILVVFLPILALQGIEGKMFIPMALTFIFAMIGAMLLCLTYVPAMSAWALQKEKNRLTKFGDKVVHALQNTVQSGLQITLAHPIKTGLIALTLFVTALFTFNKLGAVFIPELDEGDIAFHAFLKPGSALSESIKTTTKIEKIIKAHFPEVKTIVSKIGVADIPTDPMPMDIADIFAILKPKSEWRTDFSKSALVDQMKHELEQVVGVNFEFSQPIEMRFNELLTGAREDIAIKIYGDDLHLLQKKGDALAKLIGDIKGVADIKVGAGIGLPQISIRYERQKMAQYGISIDEVNQILATALAGWQAGQIFEGEKVFDLVVRLAKPYRQNLFDIQQIPIKIDEHTYVPLKELATIAYDTGPMQINRDQTHRNMVVGINVRNRDIGSLVAEIRERVKASFDLPTGYYLNYGGAFKNLSNAVSRLQWVVPLVLVLILILIYTALKSIKQTLMIYIAIPLASIGGVMALYFRDMPFSISAAIGFIVLFGVAVLNGLVLISRFSELQKKQELSLKALIFEGVHSRIRPILLTALTDILGFLPMAIATSAGAAVQRPLATVVIGGLLSATFLTLFILPMIYYLVYRKKEQAIIVKTRKKNSLQATTLWLLLPCFCLLGHAQTTPKKINSLQAFTAAAMGNNEQMKAYNLETAKAKTDYLKAFDLGTTTLFRGGEELNGTPNSGITGWGIQLSNAPIFQIPSALKTAKIHTQKAANFIALQRKKTKRMLHKKWANTVITHQKHRAYQRIMPLLAEALTYLKTQEDLGNISGMHAAELRYERRKLALSANSIQNDFLALRTELQSHTTPETVFDFKNAFKDLQNLPQLPISKYDTILSAHIENQYNASVVAHTKQGYQNAKAGLLPKLSAIYTRQQVDGNTGFYSFQLGLVVPILSGKNLASVKRKRIEHQQVIQEMQWAEKALTAARAKAHQHYKNSLKKWTYYRDELLPLKEQLLSESHALRDAQKISYQQWINHAQKALNWELEALETFKNYLITYFDHEYYLNK